MSISAAQVKEVRERTGAGMMECKKALLATEGDIEKAIEAMRKAGVAKAAKKAGRIAAEGIIVGCVDSNGKSAALAEVNCETDFVGRDASFKAFAVSVVKAASEIDSCELSALLKQPITSGKTVEEGRQELTNQLGENIQVRRFGKIKADGIVGEYIHGGRIGALVALNIDDTVLARDIAMHVTASNPQAISEDEVPAELVEKEKEIFKAQSEESGKPAEIIEKMVTGRIKKFLNEVSLLGQPFVKDPSISIADLLKQKKCGRYSIYSL